MKVGVKTMNLSPIHIYRETNFPLQHVSFLLEYAMVVAYIEYLKNCDALAEDTSIVTDLLEKEIKEIKDDTLRKKAINLKRDIHNKRSIAQGKINMLSEALSSDLLKDLTSILSKQEILRQEYLSLQKDFELYSLKETEYIKDIFLKDDELKNSIILTNDTIIAKLEKYLSTPLDNHDRNLAKLEPVLVRFLTRAAMKTSPMANLTYSGIGAKCIKGAGSKKLYPRISNNVILKMFDEICKEQHVREQLTYRLCRTLIKKDGKYYVTVLSNSTENTTLHKSKQILSIFNSNIIFDSLFEYLEKNKTLTFNDMFDFLKTLNIDSEKAKLVLNNLIEQSILERTVYLDEQADSIIKEMIYYLNKFGYDEKVINEFEQIETSLLTLGDSISYQKIIDLYSKIESLSERIPIGELKRRNLLYIDGIDHSIEDKYEDLSLNIINNLAYYQFIAIALDPIVRLQFVTGEHFKKNYGKEIVPEDSKSMSRVLRDLSSMFSFDEESQKMFLGEYDWGKKFENEDLEALHQASRNIIYTLKDQINNSEILLKDDYLNEMGKTIRGVVSKDLISHSFFLQKPIHEDKVVINHLYKGYGIYFARFLKYFDNMGDEYKEYIDKCFNKAGIADIRNTFGFNANVRSSLFDREFTLPIGYGKESDKTISWDNVGFRYNEQKRKVEIFDKETKEIIRPQYLGTLISLATPSLMNIFDMLASHGTIYLDLGELLIKAILKETEFIENKILHIPRISLGDKGEVVVSRSKWLLNSNLILNMYDKNNKFETWRNVFDKFKQENLPMRFYIRSYSMNIEDISFGKSDRKPQFINLASPHLFDLFIQTLKKNDHMIIEEEFPIAETKNETVKEYIYEITHEGDAENESA